MAQCVRVLEVRHGWFCLGLGFLARCGHSCSRSLWRLGVGASCASWRRRLVARSRVSVRAVRVPRVRVFVGAHGGGFPRLAGMGAVRRLRFAGLCRMRASGSGVHRQGGASGCRAVARRVRAVAALSWVVAVPGLPFPPGVVAVAGSRSLPPQASALVGRVSRALVRGGCSLVVGCCVGADAAVLSSGVPASVLRVFAAFGPVSPPWRAARYCAPGASSLSAVSAVASALLAGSPVVWWAGGGPSVPLGVRLAARTRAVVAQASAGLVVFFGSPFSRGSLLAAGCAVARSLPAVAFPVGFPGSALPSLGAGAWAPVGGRGVWSSAWRWVPAQAGVC